MIDVVIVAGTAKKRGTDTNGRCRELKTEYANLYIIPLYLLNEEELEEAVNCLAECNYNDRYFRPKKTTFKRLKRMNALIVQKSAFNLSTLEIFEGENRGFKLEGLLGALGVEKASREDDFNGIDGYKNGKTVQIKFCGMSENAQKSGKKGDSSANALKLN